MQGREVRAEWTQNRIRAAAGKIELAEILRFRSPANPGRPARLGARAVRILDEEGADQALHRSCLAKTSDNRTNAHPPHSFVAVGVGSRQWSVVGAEDWRENRFPDTTGGNRVCGRGTTIVGRATRHSSCSRGGSAGECNGLGVAGFTPVGSALAKSLSRPASQTQRYRYPPR